MADSSSPAVPENSSSEPSSYIVPDDDPHAGDDPAFLTDSDVASSKQSLTSSVVNYQYENGRRYHGYREGEYPMPNDDREQDRLDLHHHIFRLATGGALFRAPIDPSTARILDLGTGTGIWVIEMGDEYPKATITGTDLSPIQPGWVPPNCYFEVDDFESDWSFSRPFDFIHGRVLTGSVRSFPDLYRRIKDNLAPGGWVEMVELPSGCFSDDDSLQKATSVREWAGLQREAGLKFGKPMDVAENNKQWMIDAGFKNVKEEIYKVPLNPWAKDPKMKELGRYQQVNALEAMEAYSLALFTRVLGMSNEEVQVFFAGLRREVTDRSLHLYAKVHFAYGQKGE